MSDTPFFHVQMKSYGSVENRALPATPDEGRNLIERWEALAKDWVYGSASIESIDFVQQECSELTLPDSLAKADGKILPSTEEDGGSLGSASNSNSSPVSADQFSRRGSLVAADSILLNGSGAIETTQQFYKWFVQIEEEMEQGQEDGYRTHLTLLRDYQHKIKGILLLLDSTLAELDAVLGNYVRVDGLIRGVQASCDRQVEEQTQLLQLHSEIKLSLQHFRDLEAIVKFLSTPGDDICLDDRFEPLLDDLDSSMAFLQRHNKYVAADFYIAKYRQFITRALSIIKSYFTNSMRTICLQCLQEAPPTPDASKSALELALPLHVYVPFQAAAPRLRVLIVQVEKRVADHVEYQSLLSDCLASYFQARHACIDAKVSNRVTELSRSHQAPEVAAIAENDNASNAEVSLDGVWLPKEILSITQSGCAYLKQLCLDETELMALFFKPESAQVADRCRGALLVFLEQVCSSLYIVMRPLILQESRIDVLIQLCQTLSIYVREDEQDSVLFVIHRILADTQQRLIFRAQQFMQQEISRFKVDATYMELIDKARGAMELEAEIEEVTTTTDASEDTTAESPLKHSKSFRKSSLSTLDYTGAPSVGSGGEWYPTVGRTLWILNKLYSCVQPGLFEDLAHDAIELCRQSLVNASLVIKSKKGTLDAELFLVKNYLLLREHLASDFQNVQFIRKSTTLDLSYLIAAPVPLDAFHSSSLNMLEARTPVKSPASPVMSNSFESPLSPSLGAETGAPWSLQSLSRATSGLVQVLANPKKIIVERISDEKKELDQDLRKACEVLITDIAQRTLEPISQFLERVAQMQNRSTPDKEYKFILQNQSFALPEQLALVVQSFSNNLRGCLLEDFRKIQHSLRDPRTEKVLVGVIKTNIVNTYQVFYQLILQDYAKDTVETFVVTPEQVKSILTDY